MGFLVAIKSFMHLNDTYTETGRLKYLLGYKYSQDHIQSLFAAIRSRCGYNNNPSTMKFSSTYKRLLVCYQIQGGSNSNCIPQDSTTVLICSRSSIRNNKKVSLGDGYELHSQVQSVQLVRRGD